MPRPAAGVTTPASPTPTVTPTVTPTRRLRVEALRRVLQQADEAVSLGEDLVRQVTPWLSGR